jgi:hypothetical protein
MDWIDRLDEAPSEEEVVRIVREYVAGWPRHDLLDLPPTCRPENIADAQQVARWAYALAASRCSRSRSDDQPILLERMAAFFAHATHRLAMLASPYHLIARHRHERLNPR